MMIDEAARNTDEIRKFIDYRMIERGGEEKGDLEEQIEVVKRKERKKYK